MARNPGTRVDGSPFDDDTKRKVWEKAALSQFMFRDEIRYDRCLTEIHWMEYGNRDSRYGWEIDHIKPVSLDGGDQLDNLQPLHWQNNARKGDKYPWTCGE